MSHCNPHYQPRSHLPECSLGQCFSTLNAHTNHTGDRSNIKLLFNRCGYSLRFCISVKLPGDAAAPWTKTNATQPLTPCKRYQLCSPLCLWGTLVALPPRQVPSWIYLIPLWKPLRLQNVCNPSCSLTPSLSAAVFSPISSHPAPSVTSFPFFFLFLLSLTHSGFSSVNFPVVPVPGFLTKHMHRVFPAAQRPCHANNNVHT